MDSEFFSILLARLKKLALTPVDHGNYLGRTARPDYQHWHFGQVIAEFPAESASLRPDLRKLEQIERLTEPSQRAYALARVLQCAVAMSDEDAGKTALKMLYQCQDLSRPLGAGIIGDHVKASLNVLEALGDRSPSDYRELGAMVEALLAARKRADRTGILVAVDRERDACVEAFRSDQATVTEIGEVVEIDHPEYQAVILTGKALIGATHATVSLISAHRVTRTIMVGIAGSLGLPDKAGKVIPGKGHVVIASAVAAYRVREKVRETTEDAPVPFNKSTWAVLPTDVTLFSQAHRAKLNLDPRKVHEGLIVTGNGIKDNPKEKKNVREKWPGGLAVAEEGFASALECLLNRVPYLEIRGISDLAEGDKAQQDAKQEDRDQRLAARNAAHVMLAIVRSFNSSA